ncbi:hypothetical protein V6K52_11185 [Knoellia sp. S7-12]|uniref:hypothetical protein n=1 Tax=Knoellia sp. S7-12 TaxID=3126698 RepID=UPI003367F29B
MTNHDDHTTTDAFGPGEASARRAKRFAIAGAAALMLGLGGIGTAYAVGGGSGAAETGYATIIDAPAEGEAPGTESDVQLGTQSGSREDCPEKDGGATTSPESEAPSQAPSQTPDAAPDTSTL